MMQAGALAVGTGFDPEADPAPQAAIGAGTDASARSDAPHTPLRLTVPLLLAAGWGALLTFSVMFLMEDGRGAVPAPERVAAGEAAPFEPSLSARSGVSDRAGSDGLVRLVSASEDAVPAVAPAVIAAVAAAPAARPAPASRSAALAVSPAVPPAVSPAAPLAVSPAASPPAERPDYVGLWGPTAEACGGRRHGYLPARITPDGARAGHTLCRFRDGRRDGIAWAMTAACSERGRRWTSQVRLLVDGDRLTWTSAKGPSTYVRCGRRDG